MMLSTLTMMQPTMEEFGQWLKAAGFRAPLATVLHNTWSPTAAQYQGRETIVAIRRFHTQTRGWSDIGANAYACPGMTVCTGRPLSAHNWSHALISRAHPETEAAQISGGDPQWFNSHGFGLETVGNFDSEDPYGPGPGGSSFECAMRVLTVVHQVFHIPADRLFFHRDVADKTCPGLKLHREQVRADLALRLGEVRELQVVEGVHVVDCKPGWSGDRITVEVAPFVHAMNKRLAEVPAGVLHANGRGFVAEIMASCPDWTATYRVNENGPRLYLKRA